MFVKSLVSGEPVLAVHYLPGVDVINRLAVLVRCYLTDLDTAFLVLVNTPRIRWNVVEPITSRASAVADYAVLSRFLARLAQFQAVPIAFQNLV